MIRSMRTSGLALAVALCLGALGPDLASAQTQAPETIRLWEGRAPGTEAWTYPERVTQTPTGDIQGISNVSEPTITVFVADPDKANGTAVMILPGGGLRGLGWDSSVQQARWFNSLGVTAVILKYRTLQMAPPDTNAPPRPRAQGPGAPPDMSLARLASDANANPSPDDPALTEVLTMAVSDAEAAMRLMRTNADEWRINPERIGMMGVSAGGGVAVGATLLGRESSPAFLISLFGPALQAVTVPDYAPPLFIAVGENHQPVANGLMALHNLWNAAGKPSELHIYSGVRMGLGTWGGSAPVEQWPERLKEWMIAQTLLPAAAAAQ